MFRIYIILLMTQMAFQRVSADQEDTPTKQEAPRLESSSYSGIQKYHQMLKTWEASYQSNDDLQVLIMEIIILNSDELYLNHVASELAETNEDEKSSKVQILNAGKAFQVLSNQKFSSKLLSSNLELATKIFFKELILVHRSEAEARLEIHYETENLDAALLSLDTSAAVGRSSYFKKRAIILNLRKIEALDKEMVKKVWTSFKEMMGDEATQFDYLE